MTRHYTGVASHSGSNDSDAFSWAFQDADSNETVSAPFDLFQNDQLTITLDSSYLALGNETAYPSRFFRVVVRNNVESDGQDQKGDEREVWTREVNGQWNCYHYSDGSFGEPQTSHILVTSPDSADTTLVITSEETEDDSDKVWICPIVVAGADPTSATIGATPPFYHPDPELILKKKISG